MQVGMHVPAGLEGLDKQSYQFPELEFAKQIIW
jgi:hypothetical protein